MKITILTLFPEMFQGPFSYSIIKRAQQKKLIKIDLVNIRDFGIGRHKIVDDRPYGGGVGMVLRVDVIDKAITNVKCQMSNVKCREQIILTDPRGKTFTQDRAGELSKLDHLILIAGHYEGVDERVKEHLVDETLSIGNYVLTGGEIPAMVVVDTVSRLISGVLTKPEATLYESFSHFSTSIEHPQYTRPNTYEGWRVPKILISGNHKEITSWRSKKTLVKRVSS